MTMATNAEKILTIPLVWYFDDNGKEEFLKAFNFQGRNQIIQVFISHPRFEYSAIIK